MTHPTHTSDRPNLHQRSWSRHPPATGPAAA